MIFFLGLTNILRLPNKIYLGILLSYMRRAFNFHSRGSFSALRQKRNFDLTIMCDRTLLLRPAMSCSKYFLFDVATTDGLGCSTGAYRIYSNKRRPLLSAALE